MNGILLALQFFTVIPIRKRIAARSKRSDGDVRGTSVRRSGNWTAYVCGFGRYVGLC